VTAAIVMVSRRLAIGVSDREIVVAIAGDAG